MNNLSTDVAQGSWAPHSAPSRKGAAQVERGSLRVPRPATAQPARLLWPYLTAVVLFHLCLPLAFVDYLFSWTGVILIPLGNYVFCSMGIGAGYHRLLTHHSFTCPKWVEHTMALLGVCCLQDSPARWVAVHRLHHQHADDQPDPHTPQVNWFWGHMGWLLLENRQLSTIATYERYARDVLQDPFYIKLERRRLWVWVYVLHAVAFYAAGFVIGFAATGRALGGVQFGLSLLLWGVIFRTLYTWHITWGVNSLSHLYRRGYRNYDTADDSNNNWLFALATNGEWHNNHHADPRSACQRHRWWEFDVTYVTLRALKLVGLVHEIVPIRVALPHR